MRDRAGNRGHGGQGRGRPRPHHTGKRCSFPWINTQIIAASETGGLQHLVSTIVVHLPQMNLVNLSTAVHRLAKITASDPTAQLELRQHPVLEELLESISSALSGLEASEAQPQSLSNVVWSLATMRLTNKPLIQVVAALAVANISCFKPFELSTMLWAFAKLGSIDNATWCAKPVYYTAATHIMNHVQHFGFRCLATTVWAFATAKQRHARLFRSIAAQMVPMVHAANCQEMANTAWAFGTADFHDQQLFMELAEKAVLRLDDFKPQELSNMLWGFATNGFFHEAFFEKASLVAQRMDLQAQHLANIFWAFARVRPRHFVTHKVILALLPLCILRLDTFKPQEVSSTALAVAKAFGQGDEGERGPPPTKLSQMILPTQVMEFFSAVIPWAMLRLREFSTQSLANTVSAYAMIQMAGSSTLFSAIGNEVSARVDSLEPTALFHLLKGFSAVPQDSCRDIMRALAAGMMHHVDELRPQEMQTLSRICVSLLGLQRSQDLNCEELRSCCFALTVGEGEGSLPMQLDPLDYDSVAPAIGPPPLSPFSELSPITPATNPILLSHCQDPDPNMTPLDDVPFVSSNSGPSTGPTRVAGHRYGRGCARTRPQVPLRPGNVWRGEEFTGHTPLCTINERAIPTVVEIPALASIPMPLPGPPIPRPIDTTGLPSMPEQELAPPYGYGHAGRFTPQVIPFLDYQLGRRGSTTRTRLPLGNPGHADIQWRCSVKNSFLHMEHSDEDPDDNWESGSSQRSSSVPSRFEHDELWGPATDSHRRHTTSDATGFPIGNGLL